MSYFEKKDGDFPNQAAITTDFVTKPIPSAPQGNPNEVYKPGAGTAPSSLLRGDVGLVETDELHITTSAGKANSACFASFGNRAVPRKGEEDEYMRNFMPVGVIKNTMTDPVFAFQAANGGVPRIMDSQVAVLVGGSCTTRYNNTKKAIFGDAIIIHPPDNRSYGRNERPVPKLGPLHWSVLNNFLRQICVAMIAYQKERAISDHDPYLTRKGGNYNGENDKIDGTWLTCAIERRRNILATIMAGLFILVRRGYILILTSQKSKEIAVKDQLVGKISLLASSIKTGKKTTVNLKDVTDIWDEYEKGMREIEKMSRKDKGHYRYNDSTKQITIVDRENGDIQNVASDLLGDNTMGNSPKNWQEQEKSLVFMINNLGLGGKTRNMDESPVIHNTITDILKLDSIGALDKRDVGNLLSLEPDVFKGVNSAIENFEMHLINKLTGHETTLETMRSNIMKRVLGTALSSSYVDDTARYNNSESVIDINLGRMVI